MKYMKKGKKVIWLSIVLVALFLFFYYENHHLVVANYVQTSEKIGADLDGYRIVHLSDFHNARFGADSQRLLKKIASLEPNMIVITGDIVDSNHTNIERAIEMAKQAAKICPVYYVTGNHEYWLEKEDFDCLMNGLTEVGVQILQNEAIEIEVERESGEGYEGREGANSFLLVGLDDRNLSGSALDEILEANTNGNTNEPRNNNRYDSFCDQSYDTPYVIVLAHEPDYFPQYAKLDVNLVLSGHIHGGQMRLPVLGGLLDPNMGFFPKYDAGAYEMEETTMIVSRGLGNSVIPVRLFNDPEIGCITLRHLPADTN